MILSNFLQITIRKKYFGHNCMILRNFQLNSTSY